MSTKDRGDSEAPDQSLNESGVLERIGRKMTEVRRDYPGMRQPTADGLFVSFLRAYAQFGVFALGPITISTAVVEQRFEQTHRGGSADRIGYAPSALRFFELLKAESARTGRKGVDELQWLLAFIRLGEGLPAEVFGELGVTPEQVEAFSRSPGPASSPLPELLSPEEAAEYLRVHVQTVRAWIRSGKLKASRLVGQRSLRIHRSDLASVLEPVDPSEFD
ncbi:MAG: helix-turn-helix domain-containing protein [Dehalococcoidia bacterium]